MKKNGLLIVTILAGLLLNGCSTKEPKVEESKITKKSDDVEVKIVPISEDKVEVITKIKPEVAVVSTEKLDEGEIPVVVVEPVEADVPVEEVEILPVVDDTVGVITKVKPTIEVIEELPLDDDAVVEDTISK